MSGVRAIGERQKEVIMPGFDRSISIDFTGAAMASDAEIFLRKAHELFQATAL